MIVSMEINAYPGNYQIQMISKAIENLTSLKDWEALVVAESELELILLDKQEWITHNGFQN